MERSKTTDAAAAAEIALNSANPDKKLQVASQATAEAGMTIDTFLHHCWKDVQQKQVA